MPKTNNYIRFIFTPFYFALLFDQALANCDNWLARPIAIEGQAQVVRKDSSTWVKLTSSAVLCQGDSIRVLDNSRLTLEMINQTIARIDEHTTLEFIGDKEPGRTWLDIIQGFAHFISRVPGTLSIKTPYMNAIVEGTEFIVGVTDEESSVVVFEGVVAASNAFGQRDATAEQAVIAGKDNKAPVIRPAVNPWDTAQWALYYPPLLTLEAADLSHLSDNERNAIQLAAKSVESGDTYSALQLFEKLSPLSPLLVHRASLLLSVGQVEKAMQDIALALSHSPKDGNALALQSIIFTVKNERELALATAIDAVQHTPSLASPYVALSYAWQSRFELKRAREVLEDAAERIPASPLLWARLAEVLLMFREFKKAEYATQKTITLDPRNAHARTIQGFSHLLRMNTTAARQIFESAIALDPSAPLPRLGSGLSLIRDGRLTQGRRALEIAVALDPTNALYRSYLGKAYFGENRSSLAAGQFKLAKNLDPNDPTAWLYDAIRKQAENRPVEALYDLEQSIDKNENRAVYRSQLLLDDDAASRNVSLARTYQDLGLDELARLEGMKSLNHNPGNHSAHRLLADSYRGNPRNEFAGISELFQSLMLAPAGINPFSLSMTQSDSSIAHHADPSPEVGDISSTLINRGPPKAGINEYTAMYTRDGLITQANGLVGSNDTFGEELIISGLNGKTAFNVGQLHFRSDGYRPNADFNIDLFGAFVQHDFSPTVSVQMEARRKLQTSGDLSQSINDNNLPLELEDKLATSSARLGVRLSPKHNNLFLISIGWGKSNIRHEQLVPMSGDIGIFSDFQLNSDIEGYNYELQNIQIYKKMKWVLGFSHDREENYQSYEVTVTDETNEFFSYGSSVNTLSEHVAAYLYSSLDIDRSNNLTIGAGIDQRRDFSNEWSQFSPKLGWTWSPTATTSFRVATFRTMKRTLFLDQTLEPTQVSGFTQMFNDPDGTDSTNYAAAIDQNLGLRASTGFEGARRRLEVPRNFAGSEETIELDREVRWYKFYFNYILSERWTYSFNYDWEKGSERLNNKYFSSTTSPIQLNTKTLSISLNYTHPLGIQSKLDVHHVNQTSLFRLFPENISVNEKFPVVDYEIGFRFTKPKGTINFIVRNVFDNSFSTQQYFESAEPVTQSYYPEQAFFIRGNLLF